MRFAPGPRAAATVNAGKRMGAPAGGKASVGKPARCPPKPQLSRSPSVSRRKRVSLNKALHFRACGLSEQAHIREYGRGIPYRREYPAR